MAAGEVRAGRGTQFAPAVVDAFFAALRRRPEAFAADGPASLGAVHLRIA